MSIEPYRQSIQDEVMTSALVRAAGNLVDDLIDRLLRTDERVATAAEGKLLIAADEAMYSAKSFHKQRTPEEKAAHHTDVGTGDLASTAIN